MRTTELHYYFEELFFRKNIIFYCIFKGFDKKLRLPYIKNPT